MHRSLALAAAALLAAIGIGIPTDSFAQTGRLLQLSTRGQVLTGDDVMIAGFVISGSAPKTIVVTVTGPSLASVLAFPLRDPTITLHRHPDGTVLKTNDNWQIQDVPAELPAIVASQFQPTDGREAAIIATLPPGAYTAVVRGAGGATGVGVVAVYELDHPEVPLINLSTRGKVLTGENVLIAGFAVGPADPAAVVVRVSGPSLIGLVPDPLQNPALTLVRMSDLTVVATNDDWQTQANPPDVAALQASSLQPNHPREPAIIATLPPGLYTAIASGVGTDTGIALVSVYRVSRDVAITSANSATFTVGAAGTFTVTTEGSPAATSVNAAGPLPAGVTFTPGTTTGTFSGTPAAGTGGTYPVTIVASNGTAQNATQNFTLVVNQPPAITSGNAASFNVGTAGTHTVVATGFPAPTLSLAGALPTGITFNPATGALSGTPAVGTSGSYPVTFTASNGVLPNATQGFTLTVTDNVAITSANATTFTAATPGTFTVTTAGAPPATSVTATGALPAGVTFTPGTTSGTLSGTPAAGTGGTYTLTITASNGTPPNATQTFTLTVNQAPAITSANAASFAVGSVGTHSVVATGFPAATLSVTGALPGGVTFNPGTGVLSGTPAAGTAGTYPLTFTAANGVTPNATQNFTLTVTQGVAITSANTTTFTVLAPGTFTVTTSGVPAATGVTASGALPAGVAFTPGVTTGTLAGTPAAGTGGAYPITITATNGTPPDATQPFTLLVNQPPAITSANGAMFTVGAAGAFTVTATGFPAPTYSVTGTLPAGVTLNPTSGALSGTPAAGTGGSYSVTINATNGVAPAASQVFTLTVNQAPAITSGSVTTFTVGAAGNFSFTATGVPAPSLSTASALPAGVTLAAGGLLSGTPAAGTGGVYNLVVVASNGVAPNASQNFTLTVAQAPAITSANNVAFQVGMAGTFIVTTTGFPTGPSMALGASGTLPAGVTFTNNNDGTATLAGTAGAGTAGTYPLTITANNGVAPSAGQPFTLTVIDPPVANSDSYSLAHDTVLNVVAPGILGNDTGSPAPTLTSVTGTGAPCTVFPCTIATANGSVTAQASGAFTFTPAAGFTGVNTFTYSISNPAGSSGATVTLAVDNAAAVVDLDGAASAGIDFGPVAFTEGGGLVAIVGTANPNWLAITDTDGTTLASAAIVLTNLQDAGAETLALTCPAGPPPACSGAIQTTDIVAAAAPGTYTITITRVAPLADYEALLRTLAYQNASSNPTVLPVRDVTVAVNDGFVASSPLAHATISIIAVNNAPALAAIEGAALAYSVSSPAAAITSTLTVSDVDSPNLAGATVQITANCTSGDDVLGFASQSGITGTYTAASCLMTLSGSSSVANYQAALRSVTYSNANSASSTATRTVSFQANDGGAANNLSNVATRSVTVAVNGAPALNAGGTLNYTENGPAAAIDTTVTVTDADSPNLIGATAQITGNCTSTEDVLAFTTQNGISGSFAAGTCTMTLTGSSSVANYQAALRSVRYSNSSENPGTAARTVTWQVNDGGAVNNLSNTATSTVNVTATPDAPVLTAGATAGFTEDGPAVVVDGTVTVTDPDSTTLASATVQITGNCSSGEDVLAFTNQNGITGVYTAGTCLMSLTGSAALADYQAALRSITYANTSQNPSTAARTVTWIGNDGAQASAGVTSTVNVAAVNDAPVLAALEVAALGYTENGPAAAISATLTANDVDSTNLAGATVQLTANCAPAEDVLAFTNQNGITGAYNAASCLMTLTGSSSVANYQAAIRSVAYSNSSENPSTLARTLSIQVNDGGAVNNLGNTLTRTISVTAVNDPPTATAFAGLPAQAGIPITYPAGKLGGTDPEGTAVTVDTTPINATNGTVALNANGGFSFTPSPLATTASFQYRVTDAGSPLPPQNSAYVTVSFTVSGPAIFFVKNPAVGLANCTLGNECLFATAITNIGGATNANIFIGDAASHTAGSTLNSGGSVYGQGVASVQTFDQFFGILAPAQGTLATRPSLNLGRPTVTQTTGTTLTVTSNNTLRGFNLGNSSATGTVIAGTNFGTLTTLDMLVNTSGRAFNLTTGTFNATFDSVTSTGGANNLLLNSVAGTVGLGNGAMSGATGDAFGVIGGTANVTYFGPIASGGARSVSVASKTGGTISLNGTVTDTDSGIALTNNTGATIAFTGTLTLSTGTNAAFSATGGGTVSSTGAGSTITTTSGTALNVANTTIGAGGLNFTSISSSGGTGNGIVLDNTGAVAGLTVTGDGANTAVGGNGTGGTIANKGGSDANFTQGIGIYLNNTKNVVLRRMIVNGTNQNFGIRGTLVDGFTLEYSTVNGTQGTAATLTAPENAGEGAVYFGNVTTNGITGAATFTNNIIGGGRARNLSIINTLGTQTLTIKGNTFQLNQAFNDANQSLLVEARGGTVNATLGGTLAGEPNSFAGAPGDNVNFTGQTGSNMTVTMRNNSLTNAHANNVIGGGGLTLATQGTMNFVVDNNVIRGADGSAVTLFKASGATLMSGIFNNNQIGQSGVSKSGSKSGNGIFVSAAGTGTMSYTITNNQIRQYAGNAAIYADNTGGSYTANFTITGNVAAEPVAPNVFAGLAITNGSPGSTDTVQVCADIRNNDFSAGDPANSNDIIVGASGAGSGHTFVLPGYAGASLANVQTFIQNNNLIPGSTAVFAYVDAPATVGQFAGTGSSCPTP